MELGAAGTEASWPAVIQLAPQVLDRLAERLPGYMVPSVFFRLAAMPTTASGKTDRKRLREMGLSFSTQELAALRTAGQRQREAPSTEAERQLQQLWAEVLGLAPDDIGRDDSFFRLGGDSVMAMRLAGAARRAGVGLAVADVFRNPKLRDLAAVDLSMIIEEPRVIPAYALLRSGQKDHLLHDLQSSAHGARFRFVSDILPLTSSQEQWVSTTSQHPRTSVHYYWLELGQHADPNEVQRSCRALFDLYPILHSSFVCLRSKWWQVVLRLAEFPFRTAYLRGKFEAQFEALCARDTELLKLNQCPTGFILAQHRSGRSRLAIRLSHAQYDGTSVPILWQAFADLYHHKTPSASLTISSYLAYSQLIRHNSESYWKQLLQGSRLAPLFPESHSLTDNVAITRFTRVKLSSRAPHLAGEVTMASLISAAWAMLLSDMTGKVDVVFGHLVAGRNAKLAGIENICAPCINIIPVRVKLSVTQGPSQLLRSTHEQFTNLGEADCLGWKDIVESCTDWPAGSRFDSVIQHQNIEEHPEIDISGARNRVGWVENPHGLRVPPSLTLVSYPRRDFLTFQIASNVASMTEAKMQDLLRRLFAMMEMISDDYKRQPGHE